MSELQPIADELEKLRCILVNELNSLGGAHQEVAEDTVLYLVDVATLKTLVQDGAFKTFLLVFRERMMKDSGRLHACFIAGGTSRDEARREAAFAAQSAAFKAFNEMRRLVKVRVPP